MKKVSLPLSYDMLEYYVNLYNSRPFTIQSLDGKSVLEMSKLRECLIRQELEWLNRVLDVKGVELYICEVSFQ